MADQQETATISYSVAAAGKRGNPPAAEVSITLTYDTSNAVKVGGNVGYLVTGATGTYTTSDGQSHEIELLRRQHIGVNDNRYYPDSTFVLDRHGLSFTYVDPLKHAPKHLERFNVFLNPQKSEIEQYNAYKSRTANGFPNTSSGGNTANVAEADVSALCFTDGTLIRTSRGDVAVEALVVGDVAVTATGDLRRIEWIGHRVMDLRDKPAEFAPVRIAAHAFGPDMPSHELSLSPGHPVLVGADADHDGGWLVPIMCLINGTTVRRVAVESVRYWHVELDAHDILLAEGLPAESYLELGDRAFFTHEADGPLTNPDLVMPGITGRCRPVAIDGAVVEAERDRLDAIFVTRLADACAWPALDAASVF